MSSSSARPPSPSRAAAFRSASSTPPTWSPTVPGGSGSTPTTPSLPEPAAERAERAMSDLLDRLRVSTCTAHHVHACERCIAQHERYVAWWATFSNTPPELGLEDLDVERRNE